MTDTEKKVKKKKSIAKAEEELTGPEGDRKNSLKTSRKGSTISSADDLPGKDIKVEEKPVAELEETRVSEEIVNEEEKPTDDAPATYYEAPPASTKKDIDLLQNMDTRRIAELMEAFSMFDFDQDGVISMSDLRRTFASLDKPNVEEEELRQMLSEGLTPLDFDAFVVLMGYKTLELDAEETLMSALAQWDYGSGLISEERIRHDLMVFGDRFTEEEAEAALEDAPVVVDKIQGRMIDYIKFSSDLCGLRKRMQDYQQKKTK